MIGIRNIVIFSTYQPGRLIVHRQQSVLILYRQMCSLGLISICFCYFSNLLEKGFKGLIRDVILAVSAVLWL